MFRLNDEEQDLVINAFDDLRQAAGEMGWEEPVFNEAEEELIRKMKKVREKYRGTVQRSGD